VTVPARVIRVGGRDPYPVTIGWGISGPEAPGHLRHLLDGAAEVAVVYPGSLTAAAERLAAAVRGAHAPRLHLLAVPDGEAAKEVAVAAGLWARLAGLRLSRADVIVGCGGGATTDLAGFVAGTWLRGVRLVQVPTTLLGMVDAAIGAKTAVNLAAGKNLVGVIHAPAGVLCDLAHLSSLPAAERASGLAEVAKCGFIADPDLLDLLEDPEPHLEELVVRSVAVKARVVAVDLREAGPRETLNYGHTLGHAIERVEGYTWRHGAAISVGMVYAARLAGRVTGLPAAEQERHPRLLHRLGLPVSYRADAWPAVLEAMRADKKARAGTLRFVLLRRIGNPHVVPVDEPLLAATYADVCR
jgi:3-dehydroquinate synthase